MKKKWNKKWWGRIGGTVVAIALIVAMTIGMIPSELGEVKAASLADLSTIEKYTESLGDTDSTQYAGRIWSDKSVWNEDSVQIEAFDGTVHTVTRDAAKGEDFLVGFSALATSQSITGKTKAPLDVVFIVDLSGSMSNNSSNMAPEGQPSKSRISYTVDALNESIQTLMDMNENTRVAVLGFETDTQILLPLDHYEKTSATTPFFRLSSTTPASSTSESNAPTLYVNAINSSGQTVNRIEGSDGLKVYGGTNLQMGLYEGMNLLASENETTVNVNGQSLQRYPAVVVLSDGQPTYAMRTYNSNWWAPVQGSRDNSWGSGNGAYYGLGMIAMMTGAYMKQAIDRNYNLANTGYNTSLYTIGVGVDGLSGNSGNLARVTLNPEEHYNATNNNMAREIRDAWETYTTKNAYGNSYRTVSIEMGDGDYTLRHPSEYDIVPAEGDTESNALRDYVDEYWSVSQGAEVGEAFQNIVSNISLAAVEIPTRYDAANPFDSGHITYTDPIGEYMEVKNMKSIIYAGKEFEYDKNVTGAYSKTGSDTDYTETYVFSGSVDNPAYGKHDLKEIEISVATKVDDKGIKTQTVTIKIPAAAIPIRVNKVELDTEGNVVSHTNDGTYPLRVIYGVGLQDILKGDGYVKSELISAEYKAKNLVNGNINFYSNLYTGTNLVNGYNAGDATVEFEASLTNPFYYVQDAMMIYEDEAFTKPASATMELDDNKTYYYKETYYYADREVTNPVIRTGKQLKAVEVIELDDAWHRAPGTVRTNRMLVFNGEKTLNDTNTAETFYTPSFVRKENAASDADGKFVVYLGNNGLLTAAASGVLDITKTVTADEGLAAPDKDFTFKVALTGVDAADEFTYGVFANGVAVTDEAGNPITGTIKAGGTLKIKAGQTARIIDLPPGTSYEVTEQDIPAGFTLTTENGLSGTLTAGETSAVAFNNHYKVSATTFPENGPLTGTKTLKGRYADSTKDTFAFRLIPTDASYPLPSDYNDATGVVVTLNPDSAHAKADPYSQEFNIGNSITFTKPGVYSYSIVEKEPSTVIPSMTYSRAQYSVVVVVTDNGNGGLDVDSKIVQTMSDSGAEMSVETSKIEFVNTYSAEDVVGVPVALKNYKDNSGQNPLKDGMFSFKFEPVGHLINGEVVTTNVGAVPMQTHDGTKTGNRLPEVVKGNVESAVTFGNIYYTQAHLGQEESITYIYKFTEVIPAGANEGNGWTLNGMTYDPTTYYACITVSKDSDSNALVLGRQYYILEYGQTLTPITNPVPTFDNTYTPVPVTLTGDTALKAEKILLGREWKDSDEFNFKLEAADTITSTAIENGNVVVAGNEYGTTISKADGEADVYVDVFSDVTFSVAGTYKFKITESKGNIPGMDYDSTVYDVTVTVTDVNGVLQAAVVYHDGTEEQTQAVFENVYTANPTTEVTVLGKKNLNGKEIQAGTYWFEIETVTVGRAAQLPAVSAATDGTFTLLDSVSYNAEGQYVYLVRERVPGGATLIEGKYVYRGVTYDNSVYKITVTVTDDTEGQLHAETKIEKSTDGGNTFTIVEGTDEPKIQFTNIYEAASVSPAIRPVRKEISGYRNKPLEEKEFSFEVSVTGPKDGWTFGAYTEGQVLDQTAKIIKNQADGTISPIHATSPVTFIKPGTYSISMKEVIPEEAQKIGDDYVLNGIIYDTHVITTTYQVYDDGDGNLRYTIDGTTGATTFTNEYVSEGKQALTVEKIYTDKDGSSREWKQDVDTYTFVLTPYGVTTTAEWDAKTITVEDDKTSVTIDWTTQPEKKATFGDIVFTKPGTYQFMVREVKPANDLVIRGVTYDVTPRIVTITVTDNGNGTMTANIDSIQKTVGEETIDATLEFTNVYDVNRDPLDGHKNLQITKELVGREWLDSDAFNFTMIGYGADTISGIEKGEVIFEGATSVTVTKHNKDNETAHFGSILFKKEGTYQFVITETIPQGATKGITYDNTARLLTVKVTLETDYSSEHYLWALPDKLEKGTYKNGVFTPLAEGAEVADKKLVFTNAYEVEDVTLLGEEYLTVTKELVGRNWDVDGDDSFEFNLKVLEDYGEAVVMEAPQTVNVTSGTKKAHFGNITFKEAGVYKFEISEVDEPNDSITCDTPPIIVTVTVTDNNEGNLVTEVEYSDNNENLLFTNTYTPDAVDVILKAYKTLAGREWLDTERFAFYITRRVPANAPIMNSIYAYANGSEVTSGNTKTVEFGAITFTQPGTYTYYINEIGTHAGITRDTRGLVAVVTVTNNQATGKLEAEVSYTFGGVAVEAGEFATFVNTYHTSGTLEGAKDLKVTKDFTGRANNTWRDSDTFTFTLEANGNETEQAVADGVVTLPANADGITIAAADKNAGYQKAFGDITFTKPGTYYFAVKETIPTGAVVENGKTVKDGIAYDTVARIVKVTATDNYDGTMNAVAEVEDGNTLTFKNVYEVKEATLNGNTELMVKKELEGRNWISGDEFTFTLAAKDEFTLNAVADDLVILPADATGIKITSADAGYQKAFGDITFTKIGTYQFVITETDVVNGKGADNGTIAKNTEPITVIVDVSDNHAGKLVATVTEYSSGSAGLTFKNTFTPKAISVNLTGTKKLLEPNNDTLDLTAGQFAFKVQKPENAPAGTPNVNASGSSASNTENGSVVFENVVTFKEAGTFVYDIVEVRGSDAAITYDNTIIKATVKIEYRDETGDLTIATGYPQYSVNNQDGFVFTNKYISKPAKFSLDGTKNVTVQAGKYQLNAEQFEFRIEPTTVVPNDPITQAIIVKNAADATLGDDVHQAAIKLFDNVEYAYEGTYVYNITEVDGKYAGFSYDSAIYQLTVEVAYNKGQLVATPIITKNQNTADEIVFNNTYNVHKAGITIEGTKELISDDNKPLENGKYTFKLVPEKAENPMPTSDTATNTGTAFNFGEITFTADDVGTYKYKVQEVKGNEPGITYDDTVYTVTIKVELKEVGGIKNTVVVTKDKEAQDIVFKNKYVPKEVVVGPNATASIGGKKSLEGRELKANEFEFKLVPEKAENPMPNKDTVKNAADKTFVFGDITYTKTGTYKYTIEEINGGLGGVKYDNSVYGVIVEVTDEGFDGQLDAKVTYTLEASSNVDVEFKNTYTAKEATFYLEGMKKSLKYADLKEGAFKFELTPKDSENPMPQKNIVTNGAHGDNTHISFGKITFTKTGIYEYTLVEVNDEQEYMVYDETEHTIKIEVTDDLKGQLQAKVIEPSSSKLEDIVFNNSFEMPAIEFVKIQLINGKQVGENATVKAGDVVTYVMTVKNVGTGTATGLQVMDKVPEGMTFMKESVEGGDRYDVAADGLTTWTVNALAPGESRAMSFKATVPASDKAVNWLNVASMVYENNPDNPDPTPEEPEPEPKPIPSNEVEVELKITPNTSDPTDVGTWFGLAFVSLALGTVVVIVNKKREKK